MKKFLVLYNMPQSGFESFKNASEEDKKKEMADWMQWMEQYKGHFADEGNPVGSNKRVTAAGAQDVANEVGGYSIVTADNHDDACAMFKNAPHIDAPGAYVEVMEVGEMG